MSYEKSTYSSDKDMRSKYSIPNNRNTTTKEIPKIMFCVEFRYLRQRMFSNPTHFKLMVSLGGLRKFND